MTTEDLLKPRYKVIADYPNSDLPVDLIVTMYAPSKWIDNNKNYEFTESELWFKRYPHLFKKLEWFEEIDQQNLPARLFIKHNDIIRRFKKFHSSNVIQLFDNKGEIEYEESIYEKMDGTGYELYSIQDCQPSTETEYNEYLTNQTKVK